MPNATQEHSDREALMRSLAGRLEFAVQKVGDCFTLLVPLMLRHRRAQSVSRSIGPRTFCKLGNCAVADD
jgi:hypothetical protein